MPHSSHGDTGSKRRRRADAPPVGRALGKPSDWVCLSPSPEGTCCDQGAGLREVQIWPLSLQVTRGSHSSVRHLPPRLQKGFPSSHGQTMLWLTESGSPGPARCRCPHHGAKGQASGRQPSPSPQAALGSLPESLACPPRPVPSLPGHVV